MDAAEYWSALVELLSQPPNFLAVLLVVPVTYLLATLGLNVLNVFYKRKKKDEQWRAVIFTRHAPFFELAQDSNRRFTLLFEAETPEAAQEHVQDLLKEGVVICHEKTCTFVFVPPDNILAIELNET